MSDYPRPPVEEPEAFRPDRIVGWSGLGAYAGNTLYGLYRAVQSVGLESYLRRFLGSGFASLAVGFLFMGLFAFLIGSRRVAFAALFVLLGLMLLGAGALWIAKMGTGSPFVWVNLPFWLYCAARLFGLLGPRPLAWRA